jgi:teichuronic acid biosynthesis glycosyltransferase TuaH
MSTKSESDKSAAEQSDVNSMNYWERRFQTDWGVHNGPRQTEMFAALALRMLPEWLIGDIKANGRSILDFGCAEGEAVAAFANYFGSGVSVSGIDFSQSAIDSARRKYGNLEFIHGDVNSIERQYDVVFSSNTLEHFQDPISALKSLARRAKNYVVLLLPFWEWERDAEHFITFEHGVLPYSIEGRFSCVHADVFNSGRLPNTLWNGYQALFVYADVEHIGRLGVSLDTAISGLLPSSLEPEDIVKAKSIGKAMRILGGMQPFGLPAPELVEAIKGVVEAAQSPFFGQVASQLDGLRGEIAQGARLREEESARWAQEKSELRGELSKLSIENATELELRTKEFDEKAKRVQAEQDALIKERDTLIKERDTLIKERETLINERETLINERGTLIRMMNDLRASRSWRITRPLRNVARLGYRLLGRATDSEPTSFAYQAADLARMEALDARAGKIEGAAPDEMAVVSAVERHKKELRRIIDAHPGVPIIVFRPLVDWSLPLFQRPHHIAINLAAEGFLYFYCTPNAYDRLHGFKKVEERLYVTDQFSLVDALPGGKIIHLYSTDNHCRYEYVEEHQAAGDRILYEYIDEIDDTISGIKIPDFVRRKHRELIANESVICVASADKLYQEVEAHRSSNLMLVTNGVEYAHFNGRNKDNPPSEVADWVSDGKPIVGYFGAFAVWFDYELVCKLAESRPDLNILMLGWDYDTSISRSRIAEYPNIRVLGPYPYKELPEYARFFDVSTIPFLINQVTESTSPIKLFEYMSLGKPIVTTAMPECRKYDSVLIAENHQEFIAQIERALRLRGDPEYLATLDREARDNTWVSKASDIAGMIRRVMQVDAVEQAAGGAG